MIIKKDTQDKFFQKTLDMIILAVKMPIIKVDREEFLREQFKESKEIEKILEFGPQSVYSTDVLKQKAINIINENTRKTAVTSFASGFVTNPIVMFAVGGADIAQYFAFSLKLAQQIAYIFGEESLFDDNKEVPEEVKVRIIAYLGVMFGASGAAILVSKVSTKVGKKVTAKTVSRSLGYPLTKKVGSLIGKKLTKKTMEKTITKVAPIVGGAISAATTYATFRPMGYRLVDTFIANINGEYIKEN